MSLTPGQILDNKYRIVRLIGEGGMGTVHEGENTLIARRVAIKVLHAAATANDQALLRFEREAQAAGRIGSDHILEVLDMGRLENGDRFMVMEYLDGEPLAQRIERLGKMTPQQIAPLMRQALKGLQAAHDAGIIHRDLKPDNIYVLREKAGQRDFVKIIDFGISKFSVLGNDMNMTRTGAVMGTPYYMSPEQAKGSSQVDPRSDVYAIGVIMYEAVTGRVPFDGDTFNELMFKIVLSEPPKLSEAVPDLDPKFAAIINKAMARELDDRFASAAQLMQALDAYLSGEPLPAVAVAAEPPAAPATSAASGSADTAATWSNTSADLTLPKKPAVPLAAVAALIGLLVVGGGAFAAFKLMGPGDAAEGEPTAESGEAKATEPSNAKATDPVTAHPDKAAGAKEPEAVPETVAVTPAASASAAPEASAAVPATPRSVRTTARVAPRQAPSRPKAPAPTAPAPKPKPKTSPTDFGY